MGTKTDNHYTGDKIAIRVKYSPWSDKPLRVLDVYGGKGVIWKSILRKTGRPIRRIGLDKRMDLLEFHIHGENQKILSGMNLEEFDVIDVDAYGVPVDQLEEIFKSDFIGCVFVTFIQSVMGALPKKMLLELGFPESITTKAPTLAGRRGFDLFLEWLALKGVKEIHCRSKSRKHYMHFEINGAVSS